MQDCFEHTNFWVPFWSSISTKIPSQGKLWSVAPVGCSLGLGALLSTSMRIFPHLYSSEPKCADFNAAQATIGFAVLPIVLRWPLLSRRFVAEGFNYPTMTILFGFSRLQIQSPIVERKGRMISKRFENDGIEKPVL